MTDLEVYTRLLVIQRITPYTPKTIRFVMFEWLGVLPMDFDMQFVLEPKPSSTPKIASVIHELKRQGYTQSFMTRLLDVSQSTVSYHLNKPEPPFRSAILQAIKADKYRKQLGDSMPLLNADANPHPRLDEQMPTRSRRNK